MDKEISMYYKVSANTFRSQALFYQKINHLQEAVLVLKKICLVTLFRIQSAPPKLEYLCLSHDVASGSDISPCNKLDKSLVVYRFRNVA